MHLKHCLPRCDAITTQGKRCRLGVVPGPGQSKCKYHCGGPITAAVHERNRAGTRRYWERWRIAKQLASIASVAIATAGAGDNA
jgi:hypothetical protein